MSSLTRRRAGRGSRSRAAAPAPEPDSLGSSGACTVSASSASASCSAATRAPPPGAVGLGITRNAARAARTGTRRRTSESVTPSRYSIAAGTSPMPSTARSLRARLGVAVEGRPPAARLRRRHEPQPRGGDDAEGSFRADEEALQVVAGDVLADRAAERTISPGGTTASIPVTQFPVTPYLNACGPPALLAMLPPIWDARRRRGRVGSGGRSRARGAGRRRS